MPQVSPAAGAQLSQSLVGQHSLQHLSPRVGWSQIQSPHFHRCLFPRPHTRVPTGPAPGSQPSLHSAPSSLPVQSTGPQLSPVSVYLRTLKGTRPRDGWGQAAGGRAGGDGSVTGVPPSVPQSSCHGHGGRKTALQNPWRKEITLAASLTCCLSVAWSRVVLQPHGLQAGTPQHGVALRVAAWDG